VGVVKIEGGDFGSEFALPKHNGRITGVFQRDGLDRAVFGEKDLLTMESNEFNWITESKLMESVGDLDKRLREEEHFGIINSAEELLKLRHRCKENDVIMHEETVGRVLGEEIYGVTGKKEWFFGL